MWENVGSGSETLILNLSLFDLTQKATYLFGNCVPGTILWHWGQVAWKWVRYGLSHKSRVAIPGDKSLDCANAQAMHENCLIEQLLDQEKQCQGIF